MIKTLPHETEMKRATLGRDAAYDGVFFVCVKTTHIFCRPSCPARKPLERNMVYHATVRFEGASEKHVNRSGKPRRHEEDVDNDGDIDLVFHFVLDETELGCDSAVAILRGARFAGATIEGFDLVRMVGD